MILLRATIIDNGNDASIWFHLEDGPPDTMHESFIVGTFDNVAKAEEALARVTGIEIIRMPNMVR